MPKFKLESGDGVTILGRPGSPDSMDVKPGATIEVPGDLVTSRPEPKDGEQPLPPLPEDAYTVLFNGAERVWPMAMWSLVEDKQPAKSADKPAVKEN